MENIFEEKGTVSYWKKRTIDIWRKNNSDQNGKNFKSSCSTVIKFKNVNVDFQKILDEREEKSAN